MALDLRWLANIRCILERAARRQGSMRNKQGRLLPSGRLVQAGINLLETGLGNHQLAPHLRARHVRDV